MLDFIKYYLRAKTKHHIASPFVQEFMEEGDTLKHCLFTNQYYNKKDSLVLSARIKEKPIETIEVSLTEMKVVQSRGLNNKASEYNKRIVKLMKKNLKTIKLLAS